MHRIIIAIFLILIFTSVTSGEEMDSKSSNDNTTVQESSAKPNNTPSSPIIVNIVAPDKTASEKDQDTQDRKDKADGDRKIVEFTRQLADYTFGLFTATVLLVIATCIMAYLGWVQSHDMKASIRISDRGVRISERAFKMAERANIRIGGWKIHQELQAGARFRASFLVCNDGRTFAQIIENSGSFCVGDGNELIGPPEYFPAIGPTGIVGPTSELVNNIHFVKSITGDEIEKLRRQQYFIYIWGRIKYLDVFGELCEVGYGAKLVLEDDNSLSFTFIDKPGYNFIIWHDSPDATDSPQ